MVIILKSKEMWSHYVVHQELACELYFNSKQIHQKRSGLWLPEVGLGGVWGGGWMKVVKRYEIPVIR